MTIASNTLPAPPSQNLLLNVDLTFVSFRVATGYSGYDDRGYGGGGGGYDRY